MTRKRFIKLVMSKGKQRNEANRIANLYNARNIPYHNAYISFQISHGFNGLAKTVAKTSSHLRILAETFARIKADFCKGGVE